MMVAEVMRGRPLTLVPRDEIESDMEIAALRAEGREIGKLVPLARFVRQHVDDIRAEQAAGIIVLSLERMARRHPDPAA